MENQTSVEALSFIGVHGATGLSLRDLVFFIEHASIASRPHLAAIAMQSQEEFERFRIEMVKRVLQIVCKTASGVVFLDAPLLAFAKGHQGPEFPVDFVSKLFSENNFQQLLVDIRVAPSAALRQRVLGCFGTEINKNAMDLLLLVCEARGQGVRKVDIHKLMDGNHNAAIMDLETNMHLVECTRVLDLDKTVCEERFYLKFLSNRESYNKVTRLHSHSWEKITHECCGMSPSFILQQKIKWAFAFFDKSQQTIGKSYIRTTDVEDAKVRVPCFMCVDDCLPYAPIALQQRPYHLAPISHLFHDCMQLCYQQIVTQNKYMKCIRKTFEYQLPNVGIEVTQIPYSVWKTLSEAAEGGDEDFEDDEERKPKGKDRPRIVCTFPNNPLLPNFDIGDESGGSEEWKRFGEKTGRSAKQVVDSQGKVVTFDVRRPLSVQLVESACYSRPISKTGFVPDAKRGEKKHGSDRWWRLEQQYPILEKTGTRGVDSKVMELQLDNPNRNNLQSIQNPRLVQLNFKRARSSQFDDAGKWEDDVGDEEAEEGDTEEFWITAPAIDSSSTTQSFEPMLFADNVPRQEPLFLDAIHPAQAESQGPITESLSVAELFVDAPKYMTITPTVPETDEQLGERMLKFITDNTLIQGKHIVTTDQLSVIFFNSQVKRIMGRLTTSTPPVLKTTSVRPTAKKLVGAVYFAEETFTEAEILAAIKDFERKSGKRAPVEMPTQRPETRREKKLTKPVKVEIEGKKSQMKAEHVIVRRTSALELDCRKSEYWRTRNGFDSNIFRRALRLHLELWRIALNEGSCVLSSRQLTIPKISLQTLPSRMSLSTFCVCFGLGVNLAEIFPDSSSIQWDRPVGELRCKEVSQYLKTQPAFLADTLPLLSILSIRGCVTSELPLTEDLVVKATTLSLDQSSLAKLAGLQLSLPIGIEVGSILTSSRKSVDLAPSNTDNGTLSTSYRVTHSSIIAHNILELWYSNWMRDLNDGSERPSEKIATIARNLRLKTESALKLNAAVLKARQVATNSTSEAEFLRMPKGNADEGWNLESNNDDSTDSEFDFGQSTSRQGYISNLIRRDIKENLRGEDSSSTSVNRKVIKLTDEEKNEVEIATLSRYPTCAQTISLATILRRRVADVARAIFVRPNASGESQYTKHKMLKSNRVGQLSSSKSRSDFGKLNLRVPLAASAIAKAILMALSKTNPCHPNQVHSLDKIKGVDQFYQLVKDFHWASRNNFAQWGDSVASLQTCYKNSLTLLNATLPESEDRMGNTEISQEWADWRVFCAKSHLAPTVTEFLGNSQSFSWRSDGVDVFASKAGDSSRKPVDKVEAAAELMRMIVVSDLSHFNPAVSIVAQQQIPDAVRHEARAQLQLLTTSRHQNSGRLVDGYGVRMLHSALPVEYGTDFMSDGLEKDAEHHSGKATEKAAHALSDFIDNSTWSGLSSDITSVALLPFGKSHRYQSLIRIESNGAAVEEIWNQISRRHKEEEDDDDEALPLCPVQVESLPSIQNQVDDWCATRPKEEEATVAPKEPDNLGAHWRLPRSGMTPNTLPSSSLPHFARNMFHPPTLNGRAATINTRLFSTPIDQETPDKTAALHVPGRGDFSVFRHLDGSPHTFMVNACLSKVFDFIIGRPGISHQGLVAQIKEDTLGLFSDWHVAAAIDFLVQGQYITTSDIQSKSNSPFGFASETMSESCYHPTIQNISMRNNMSSYPLV